MIQNKIFLGVFCSILLSLCTSTAKTEKSGSGNSGTTTTTSDSTLNNNDSRGNIVYGANGRLSDIWGVWGGGELSADDMAKFRFLKGWYIVYMWNKLEPEKGKFDWDYFDSQMKFAANHNLSIGFMIWVGPHSPQWVYANGVPQVNTQTIKKLGTFPYYLDQNYKQYYYDLIDKVAAHIQTLSPEIRDKLIMWMSAEGSTGDPQPYKGEPDNAKYSISEQQWFDFKKDMWQHMYKLCSSMNPRVHLLVNQANDGKYFDWLYKNLPGVWMKAGDISHTYQFNGELEYYNRLQQLETKTRNDSAAYRLRGEITVQGQWFNQNETWNMYALLTSALHFGLDIFNAAPKYMQNAADTTAFNFFNLYAGQKNPATSPGAFCVFKDGLDAADTKRFPVSKYGPVLDPSKKDAYERQLQRKIEKNKISDDSDDDDSDTSNYTYTIMNDFLNQDRINKILAEYSAYGAKRGDLTSLDNTAADGSGDFTPKRTVNKNGKPISQQRLEKIKEKQQAGGGRATSYQKKREANMVINDIGVNLVQDNYYKYLTQYAPNATSRGYWRVGPSDQPYGRFARGFDAQNNMTEMFFTLDPSFFRSNQNQAVQVRIIYLDKGKGSWSLNYSDGAAKKEAYKVTCSNSGRWITKTVSLNASFAKKLEHGSDLSLKYVSGDNTIFNSIEVLR